jgi:hypothetical protein
MEQNLREVRFTTFFLEFYENQNAKIQEKFDFLIQILQTQPNIPQKYVKHITNSDGIYELRVSSMQNEYRVLFFFEEGSLIEGGRIVILSNGFFKKDNKDYVKAVALAEQIKSDYLNNLKNDNNE